MRLRITFYRCMFHNANASMKSPQLKWLKTNNGKSLEIRQMRNTTNAFGKLPLNTL